MILNSYNVNIHIYKIVQNVDLGVCKMGIKKLIDISL